MDDRPRALTAHRFLDTDKISTPGMIANPAQEIVSVARTARLNCLLDPVDIIDYVNTEVPLQEFPASTLTHHHITSADNSSNDLNERHDDKSLNATFPFVGTRAAIKQFYSAIELLDTESVYLADLRILTEARLFLSS